MTKHALEIHYALLDHVDELPPDEQKLLSSALEATKLAYAPFSQFHVGCSVQLADGSVFLGNNQENRAFPSGICAERTALFHVGSIGRGHEIEKIAIRVFSQRKSIDQPAMPCGACRQVMGEYEQMCAKPFVVLSQGATGQILRVEGVRNSLLPWAFDTDF